VEGIETSGMKGSWIWMPFEITISTGESKWGNNSNTEKLFRYQKLSAISPPCLEENWF